MQQLGHHNIGDAPEHVGTYRTQNVENSDSSSSEDEEYKEVFDEEDHDKQGTVVFNVDSIEN